MLHGFNFSKLVFLPTQVFTYSNARNFHIFQCQVCGAHPDIYGRLIDLLGQISKLSLLDLADFLMHL